MSLKLGVRYTSNRGRSAPSSPPGGDVMPAIREQSREALPGMDTPALQEQPRVRIDFLGEKVTFARSHGGN